MALQVSLFEATDKQGRTSSTYFSNVAQRHDLVFELQASFDCRFDSGISIVTVDNSITIVGGGNWEDYGAVPGVGISGIYGTHTIDSGVTIESVVGNYMVVSSAFAHEGTHSSINVEFDIVPEAFEFIINITDGNAPGPASLIDGSVNRFVAVNVDSLVVSGPYIPFEPSVVQSGGCNIFPAIQRKPDLYGNKVYRIAIDNFTNYLFINSEPFNGGDSPKLWVEFKAIPIASNPSGAISTVYTNQTGNLGFFDEAFNGNQPNYYDGLSVDGEYTASCALTVAGDTVTKPDYTQETDFSITVQGKFSPSSKFGIAFFHEINSNDPRFVTNASVEFQSMLCSAENLPVGSIGTITGTGNSFGARVDIEDIVITQFTTYAVITGKLVPNAAFADEMNLKDEIKRIVRFAVQAEDYELTGNFIRPAWLTCYYGIVEKYVAPLGAWPYVGYTPYNHADEVITYAPGTLNIYKEDDVKINCKIKVPKYDQQVIEDRFYTGVRMSFVVRNAAGGEYFTLEKFDFPFGAVLPDDTMVVSGAQQRGFNLLQDSNKNEVKIYRDPSADTSTQFGIAIDYGVLFDWRDWISLNGVPTAFIGEENRDWYHYQSGTWKVGTLVELITTDGNYHNFWEWKHHNYDDSTVVTSSISFERLDGTPISKPIQNETCVVIGKGVLDPGSVWASPSDIWGQITVEPKQSAPRWMSSTVLPTMNSANALQPLSGLDRLQKTVSGDTVEFRCLFNPLLIDSTGLLSFTTEVHGTSRKGSDIDTVMNRTKQDFQPVKLVGAPDVNRFLQECCEPRKVIASTTDTASWKNDITSNWCAGESVEFILKKNGIETNYYADYQSTNAIPNATNFYYCTVNWRDVLISDGVGCYEMHVTTTAAGITNSFVIDGFDLYNYQDSNGNVNTHGETRITALYNHFAIDEGIDFTDSGIIDSIRFGGTFGRWQPAMKIENQLNPNYDYEKIVRRSDEEYQIKGFNLSGKYLRMAAFMLLHESNLLVTDYNWKNVEYYHDVNVIVDESPVINHDELLRRKLPFTVKVRKKKLNAISAYNNATASQPPLTINIGGVVPQDTTVNISVGGVLQSTTVVPYGENATFNVHWI